MAVSTTLNAVAIGGTIKMRMKVWMVYGMGLALCVSLWGQQRPAQKGAPAADAKKMPALKRQATPKAVVDEHLDALNRCDWSRLVAQFPPEAEFFMPGGRLIQGREKIGELFAGITKP